MKAPQWDSVEAVPQRLRRVFRGLRVEGTGAGREAMAVGLGLFIGCLPFYGFHLLISWVLGALFRLNRLKVYLAANISNPLVAPFLLFAELQTGAWLRHGSFQSLAPAAVRATGLDVVAIDLLVGSLVIGSGLAVLGAAATYAILRTNAGDAPFADLVRRASDRYIGKSIVAWEFARGKLRRDPIYRATLCGGLLPSGGTLVDVGCGQGLMLALLAEANSLASTGQWPASLPSPPRFERMIGVELRPRVAAAARAALAGDAEIVEGDALTQSFGTVRAVLLFDVLHLMTREEQDRLLGAMASRLACGGVILVREADASAGWRFLMVRVGNRVKALTFGARRQRFHFRTRAGWVACFAAHGLQADVRPMGEGTPFANLLFTITGKADASAPSLPDAPPG
jgi:uncharacterized protein (DUF2062 family)/SAM-dependent methyltransferase